MVLLVTHGREISVVCDYSCTRHTDGLLDEPIANVNLRAERQCVYKAVCTRLSGQGGLHATCCRYPSAHVRVCL